MNTCKLFNGLAVLTLLLPTLLTGSPKSARAVPKWVAAIGGNASTRVMPTSRPIGVAPQVWAATEGGDETEFLVVLADQSDLSAAMALPTREARLHYVYDKLRETALHSQASLRAELDVAGVDYRPFYIVNMLAVRGDRALVTRLAARSEVARIAANPQVRQPLPETQSVSAHPLALQGVEWGVARVNADDVWALGYTGEGIVVAGGGTGYDWDHPALINQYRGYNGITATHDYHWHDAIHSGGGICGADSPEPCDDFSSSHGTHTMGTIVGDDGGSNQIGVAPGARWIGCRSMNVGVGTPASYIECFEFFLAPYPIGGNPLTDGIPSLAPHVINNSSTCPSSEGCDWDTLQTVVENVRAAGIVVVALAGNSGSSCSTVEDPPAIYDASFSVGAANSDDNIASFSSRGPVTVDGSSRLKPDVSAPGVNIRSSLRDGGYGTLTGTSMAAPHVAGTVALLWSAAPALIGDVDATEQIIAQTARPRTTTQGCGSDGPSDVPNNVYGWGIVDALAAVRENVLGLEVTKQATPDPVQVGEQLTYTYRVTNTGDVTLNSVVAYDDKLGAVTLGATSLAPGEGTSGVLNYTVVEGDLPGPLVNTVTVTGTPPVGDDVYGTTDELVTISEPPPACDHPLTGVSLSGPSSGNTGEPLSFTASPQPGNATEPITYTWSPMPNSGQGTDSASYHWATPDTYTITLEAENCGGTVSDTHVITINPAPVCTGVTGVDLSLVTPGTIYVDTDVQFSADIAPDEATKPYTYRLTINGAPGGLMTSSDDPLILVDTFAVTGNHTVEIAIWNCDMTEVQAVTDTVALTVHEQAICVGLTEITITGATSGTPGIYTFTTSYEPINAAPPVTYLWDNGDTTATSVRSLDVGTHNLQVTATNCITAIVLDTHTITIGEPPQVCDHPLSAVSLSGPGPGNTGEDLTFTASPQPSNATLPITYTWSSDGLISGQGTSQASYRWTSAGSKNVQVTARNCGGQDFGDSQPVVISAPSTGGDAYEDDDTCAEASSIATDGTIQEHTFHDQADDDWVSFQATVGITYIVQARAPAASKADVAMEIFGDCGDVVQPGEDPPFAADVRLTIKAPEGGTYHLHMFNHDPMVYGAEVNYRLSVRALDETPDPGALVLVAGRYYSDYSRDYQENIRNVTNHVYSVFRARDYPKDRIYYLATDTNIPDVAGFATKTNLEYAITQWTQDKELGPDRAFTLYLMDHGGYDIFYLDRPRGEWVTAQELDGWLDTLQDTVAPEVRINIFIEACHSGSFIEGPQDPLHTISGPDRLVITTADVDGLAYASQEGALFSDAFLVALRQGMSLAEAFDEGKGAAQLAAPAQEPWLDGDGDGIPNEATDIQEAAQRSFAFAGSFDVETWPPYIAASEIREFSDNQGEIWAEVRVPADKQVSGVWVEIYPPSYESPTPGETFVGGPVPENLHHRDGDWYAVSYSNFDEIGEYRVVIYAKDNEGLQARPKELRVRTGWSVYLPLVVRNR